MRSLGEPSTIRKIMLSLKTKVKTIIQNFNNKEIEICTSSVLALLSVKKLGYKFIHIYIYMQVHSYNEFNMMNLDYSINMA